MSSAVSVSSLEAARPNAKSDISPGWKPSKQIKLIVLGQICVLFAISLDMTILTATLPTVAQALHADSVETFWIAASYLLANAVVQPLMAALADIFGRRSVIFSALALFTIGSIICCAANNVAAMLAGRTIQGIGGGGILSVNLIIISDLIPLRARPKFISIQQLVVSIGFNIAPIIGGVLVKATTWRWLFYINLPFCGIGLIVIPFVLKYQKPVSTLGEKLSSVDWIGSTSFVAGMTATLVGLTWGGSQYSWTSAATLIPLIGGIVVVCGTGLHEKYLATTTFLRTSLFSTWSAIAIYFCTVLQGLTLFSELYFLCLYLLSVKLYTPLEAGTYLLAFSAVCVPTSGIVGPFITRVGSYRWATWIGWTMTTLSLGLLTLLNVHTHTAVWVVLFIIAGLGQGILFIAHSVASQAACQQKDATHASAMYSFMRSLGLCLGVALGGTIWTNFFAKRLADLGIPAEIAKSGEVAVYILKTMTDLTLKESIIGAIAWSFRMLFATLCGISGLGLIIAFCFIKEEPLAYDCCFI
ncbi:uncharacterized protein MYCFIDRAFT_186251 [Pseudocercospora fijiensis CIRAD86]|uniref:Major facilitator superfamily (MFS) profile domain-containing protein n=1 Tax=Pseudocercospora fijiensis (strain CIRAD86) TaxID=383855 RepID=M3B8W9_PSEFD|nr:uncharacterized protein MYCFIDRAFT_186251 [Pseudocercospora fijiensis CIRAD86]EME85767.1 hypothetical protein MYCFIDRAFT_186251 [Pseudocercospora fijiensis CIRAD86]